MNVQLYYYYYQTVFSSFETLKRKFLVDTSQRRHSSICNKKYNTKTIDIKPIPTGLYILYTIM